MKVIKEDLNKWRHKLCPWLGILNIVKMSVLPKLINCFDAFFIKIPVRTFVDTDEIILNFLLKVKITRIAKRNFEKKSGKNKSI